MQFDPEKTAEGVRLLREAADAGDPDALCFLARTYMGERYVREHAAEEINGEKVWGVGYILRSDCRKKGYAGELIKAAI